LRPWVALSAVFALVMAVYSVDSISLLPPKLTPRSLEMATASTHVVVDTPTSSVLDLRQNTDNLLALTQRAVLLGNVIANSSVRAAIAQAANIPVEALQVAPPNTPEHPTPPAGAYNNSVSSIAKSTRQYRLSIQANPTVPMLDIYAEAPTAHTAEVLANTSVLALRNYIDRLAVTAHTPSNERVRLLTLGSADGRVVNQGIEWQTALLVFVISFGLASATVLFVARVKRGWRQAALTEQQATG
jgi:hypothetical protein